MKKIITAPFTIGRKGLSTIIAGGRKVAGIHKMLKRKPKDISIVPHIIDKSKYGRPLIIAHRGFMDHDSENTLSAFRNAIKLGADMIELDVHLTKDKHVVVIHDNEVSRTTNGHGFVRKLTLKQLKEFDCANGEKIPTLQEVIDLTKGKVGIDIEIKPPFMEKRVVSLIKKNNIESMTIVSSFVHFIVKKVKRLCPEVKTAVIFACLPIRAEQMAIEANADIIKPFYMAVLPTMVWQAHKYNIKVHAWSPEPQGLQKPIEYSDYKRLARFGVDGVIINNYHAFTGKHIKSHK